MSALISLSSKLPGDPEVNGLDSLHEERSKALLAFIGATLALGAIAGLITTQLV